MKVPIWVTVISSYIKRKAELGTTLIDKIRQKSKKYWFVWYNSLKELVLCSRYDLLKVRNLGNKGRAEIEKLLLDKYGITLREGLKI